MYLSHFEALLNFVPCLTHHALDTCFRPCEVEVGLAKYFDGKSPAQVPYYTEGSMRFLNPPRSTHRPKFPKDGNRGPIRGADGNPVELEVQVIL